MEGGERQTGLSLRGSGGGGGVGWRQDMGRVESEGL